MDYFAFSIVCRTYWIAFPMMRFDSFPCQLPFETRHCR